MLYTLFYLLVLVSRLYAEEATPKDLPLSDVDGGSLSIAAGCVNVVTGDYLESSRDLIVLGPEPLVFERSYSSTDYNTNLIWDGWRHNYDSRINYENNQATYTQNSGRATKFESKKTNSHKETFAFSDNFNGYTNIGAGVAGGRTSIKNLNLFYKKSADQFIAIESSGDFSEFKKPKKSDDYLIYNEKRMNGNQLAYEYDSTFSLSKISAKSSGTPSAWIKLIKPKLDDLKKDGKGTFRLEASDGRTVSYKLKKFKKRSGQDTTYRIVKVSAAELPEIRYKYKKGAEEGYQISSRHLPHGNYLSIDYHKKEKGENYKAERVIKLSAPAGVDAKPVPIYRFEYKKHGSKNGRTSVYDPHDNLIKYKYDTKNKRVKLIVKYCAKNKTVYSREKFFWSDEGELLCRQLTDEKDTVQAVRTFQYDDSGNIRRDITYGNLTGNSPPILYKKSKTHTPDENGVDCWAVKYSYSKDGKNLLIKQTDPNGKMTRFTYHPETDLLASKTILENAKVRLRHFYEYDANAVLVCEITDDGTGQTKEDLTGVTQRRIKRIQNQTVQPIGLPKITEEFYLDLATGKECLIHRFQNRFSGAGRLRKQKHYDSEGTYQYTLRWSYDPHGNIISETDALGNRTECLFDENNRLILEKKNGIIKKSTYDFMGRLIAVHEEHPDGLILTTKNSYDVKGQLIAVTDPFGNTTEHRYDEFGRIVATKHPSHTNHLGIHTPSSLKSYDIFGNAIEQTDVLGGVTKSSYNIRGQPLHVTYPDGATESFRYYEDGTLKSFTARNGLVSTFTYDCFGRQLSKQTASAQGKLLAKTSCTYSSFNKTSETDAEGLVTRYTYDFQGRVTSVSKADSVIHHAYDSCGRLAETRQEERINRFAYDLLDRIIQETQEDTAGSLYSFVQYSYDEAGNRKEVIKPLGTTRTEYNGMKLPKRIVDPNGNETLYAYKLEKTLEITEVDPLGNQTITLMNILDKPATIIKKNALGSILAQKQLFYDCAGNLIRTVEDSIFAEESTHQVVTDWTYNQTGKLLSLTEAQGTAEQKCTSYAYNACGQKTKTIKPDGTTILCDYDEIGRMKRLHSSDKRIDYTYTYNRNDDVTGFYDAIHKQTTERHYDANGRMDYEILGNGCKISYTYDSFGRPLTATLPDHSFLKYAYNAAHLQKIERFDANGKELYSHSYNKFDASGNLLEMKTASGDTVNYSYDPIGQLKESSTKSYKESVTYNPVGSITSIESTLDAQTYTYDDLHQLSSENGHSYRHDSLYNCRVKDGFTQKSNSLNQLLATIQGTIAYDQNGNRKKQNSTTFIYDALDRLVEVKTDNLQLLYTYDAFNRRLSKTVSQNGSKTCTQYLYFGQNEVGAYNDQQELVEFRALGIGKGAEIGATVAIELKGTLYIPLSDHNGNIVMLLNSDGSTQETYRYSAFGKEELPSAVGNPWRFASKRFDGETSFINFGRRYYDPENHTWLTPDPLGFEAGPNLYAYVSNSPIDTFDLYGLYGVNNSGPSTLNRQPATPPAQSNAQRSFYRMVKTPGRIIQTIGDHIVSIPIVRDIVSATGHVLQGGRLKDWKPAYDRPQCLGPCGSGETNSKSIISFKGGMTNNAEDARRMGEEVSTKVGQPVMVDHGGNQGFINDCLHFLVLNLGFTTPAVLAEAASLRRSIAQLPPDGEFHAVRWSLGAKIFSRALEYLTPEERSKIHAYTIGTSKIISGYGLKSTQNYINNGDGVPFIADPINYLKAAFTRRDPVRFAYSGTYGFNHSFADYGHALDKISSDINYRMSQK